jgi:hypothetical protein
MILYFTDMSSLLASAAAAQMGGGMGGMGGGRDVSLHSGTLF